MAYTPEQQRIISLALNLSRGQPQKLRMALLEALAVESSFRNLGYGDRDSEGPLQQRPSQGWGSAAETPAQDIKQFLARGRGSVNAYGTPGQLAQGIQRSAFPERYDQRAAQAAALLGAGGRASPAASFRATPGLAASSGLPPRGPATGGSLTQGQRYVLSLAGLGDIANLVRPLPAPRVQVAAPVGSGRVFPGLQPAGGNSVALAEMFYDPEGGLDYSGGALRPTGAIGGHGTHVHAAFRDPQSERLAISLAQRLGLRLSENPQFGGVNPVHTKGSFHYRDFPGTKMGEAIDVTGAPPALKAFYRKLKKRAH